MAAGMVLGGVHVTLDVKRMRDLVERAERLLPQLPALLTNAHGPVHAEFIQNALQALSELKRLADGFGEMERTVEQLTREAADVSVGYQVAPEHAHVADNCPCPKCVERRYREATTGELCQCAACVQRREIQTATHKSRAH